MMARSDVLRIALDCFAAVRDGAVLVALGDKNVAAVVVRNGVLRVELDSLGVIGDGWIVLALAGERGMGNQTMAESVFADLKVIDCASSILMPLGKGSASILHAVLGL